MQTGILVLRATDDVFVAQARYVHPESFSIGELKLDTSSIMTVLTPRAVFEGRSWMFCSLGALF